MPRTETPIVDKASRIIGPIAGSGIEVIEESIARRLERDRTELIGALRGMVGLIDHLHNYPKANPRKFFFLRDGGEHGNIHDARALLAKLSKT